MKRIVTYAACLALVVGVPLLGYAQSSTRDDRKATTSKLSMSDQRFVKNAAQGNKAEVELGRLASERGSSDTVKQLGQKMVTDHGKANDDLAQLAQHKGVMLPRSWTPSTRGCTTGSRSCPATSSIASGSRTWRAITTRT